MENKLLIFIMLLTPVIFLPGKIERRGLHFFRDPSGPLHRLCIIHQKALLRNKEPAPSANGIHGQKTAHLKTALDYLYEQKDPALCVNGTQLFNTFALAEINLNKNPNHAFISKNLEKVWIVPPRKKNGKLQTRICGGIGYRLKSK